MPNTISNAPSGIQDVHYPALGALPYDGGIRFRVWTPKVARVTLVLEPSGEAVAMQPAGDALFTCDVPDLKAGSYYRYRLDHALLFPDPASRFQPEGVHGPSMVVDPTRYRWHDDGWRGIDRKDLVFYELHVGTFSPEGTFRGVLERLPYLKDLGITAIELMPIADFAGRWNWGYDPAALYAPSRAYGTPDELRALVDAAHQTGMAVFLDVVYNHLGPDGAYVAAFMPMFTDRHHTPWGQAINLDDEHAEGIRRFFIDNALHWLSEYHFDGLRLDATHALVDDSETHFLVELAEAVEALPGPRRYLIAEDHRNLNTLILPRDRQGYGLDGVWVDDFHHQIRHITAGDREGYYADFAGMTAADVVTTLRQGWYYTGQRSPGWGRPRGTDPSEIELDQCVFCIQNHDQIGNRPSGNRLSDDIPIAVFRAASALLLFAPELPLVFMGQEWAASSPFQFFTDHNETLGRAITKGRKEEFQHFAGFQGEVPDPQDPATFERSRLDWSELDRQPYAGVLELYRTLLALRPGLPGTFDVEAHGDTSLIARRGAYHLLVSLAGDAHLPLPEGASILWHTEAAPFTEEGRAPVVEDGTVYFDGAAALLARL